jgi:predicted phosphodiesterase
MSRLVLLSDTHTKHREILHIPDGDILIHAGDFSFSGSFQELFEFNAWLGTLPHRHKVVIAGNHDSCFERHKEMAIKELFHAHYLEDSGIEIEGIKIWGSPWQPSFMN